jgi:hypothetical protein
MNSVCEPNNRFHPLDDSMSIRLRLLCTSVIAIVLALTNVPSLRADLAVVHPDAIEKSLCLDDGTLFRFTSYRVSRDGKQFRFYLYRSQDGGMHWEDLYLDDVVDSLYRVVAVGNSLIGQTLNKELFRSDDRGVRWYQLPYPPEFDTTYWSVDFVSHRGRVLAYGYKKAWLYELAEDRWVMGPILYNRSWSNPQLLNDGQIVFKYTDDVDAEKSGLYAWSPTERSFRLIEVPDIGVPAFQHLTYARNGVVYYVSKQYSVYTLINGAPTLLCGPRLSILWGEVEYHNDMISMVKLGYYTRSAPDSMRTYEDVTGTSSARLAAILMNEHDTIIQLGVGFYRVESWDPLVVTEVWYDRDPIYNTEHPMMTISSNGTWLTNIHPNDGSIGLGFSVDGGLSWHSRKIDVECDSDEAILTGSNGLVMSLQKDNCFNVSYDNARNFEELPWMCDGLYPYDVVMHEDGSVTFFTSRRLLQNDIRMFWYASSIGSPLEKRPYMNNYSRPITKDVGYRSTKEAYSPITTVYKTDDGGLTDRVVFRDSTDTTHHYLEMFRISDREMAIVMYPGKYLVSDSSRLYLVDVETDAIRLIYTCRGMIIGVARRPNGQLNALLNDLTFLVFGEGDRFQIAIRDNVIGPTFASSPSEMGFIATDDILLGYSTLRKVFCRLSSERNITGLEETPPDIRSTSVTLFPNPSTGIVQCKGAVAGDPYRVFDTTGRMITSGETTTDGFISLGGDRTTSGLVLVVVQTSKGILTGKVVLQ